MSGETRPARTGAAGSTGPSIGLVLGGGGARGLAHILMLEVFDEFGIRPKVIAGTSIGAIFGAAYAAGLSAGEIREHTEVALTRRLQLVRDLVSARVRPRKFWNVFSRHALLEPAAVLDLVLPPKVDGQFSDLPIPLKVVASDFYALAPVVLAEGSLREAIAASIALPVIFDPVVTGGRTLIDGGLTNPLPFDLIEDQVDLVVAIDVSGETVPSEDRPHPTAIEALFSASYLFERSIVREKLKLSQPDIYVSAGTGRFQALEFLKVREILAAAEPAKERLRASLGRVLGAQTVRHTELGPPPPEAAAPEPQRRGKRHLLRQLRRRRRGDPRQPG